MLFQFFPPVVRDRQFFLQLLQASLFGRPMSRIGRVATSTSRTWTDSNSNYVPDCDLRSPAANGECGAMANRSLGTNTVTRTWDPNFTSGWGKRPYNWEMAASVQQEIAPRVAVTVGYFRRAFGNWYTTQNLATSASDFTPFYLTAPLDSPWHAWPVA